MVVVAGGPRAGDFVAGSVARASAERAALVVGGLACMLGVVIACLLQRDFLRYDDRDPSP